MIAFEELITLGVKKIRKYGFTHVNKQNILTDEVYRLFFERILKEHLEKNNEERNDIRYLLKMIKLNTTSIISE